jgi:hypothetical protein
LAPARAVGVLCRSRFEARLAEQRRLLIAGITGDGDFRAKEFRIGVSVDLAGGFDLGHHRARHVQQLEQLIVPLEGVDVEQQRPAGVADVGDVALAPRQTPDQERIDRPEENLAPRGTLADTVERIQQVLNLRAGKIRVHHEACLLPEERLVSRRLQAIADRRGDAALPHNRIRDGLAGRLLPQHGGLALIGDTNGRYILGADAGLRDRVLCRLQLRGPNRFGIVLDVSGPGKNLRKFLLRRCDGGAAAIEHDGAAGGGALVKGEHEFAHRPASGAT